jgi:hypothetical protein
MQSLVKTIADFSTTLTSKTAVAATTATLTSGLDADGIQLPTGTYGFTVDRGNSSKEYFTATLTGSDLTAIKTVTRGTGLGTSGLVRAHRKGAEVIISDHVALKRMMNVLDGTTDLDSATVLKYDGTATISNSNALATKKYVDDTASAGAPLATAAIKGIVKMSVAPVSAGSPIAVGDNDTRLPTTDQVAALAGTGTPSGSNKFVTADNANLTNGVKLTGDQTVAGVKTFSSIPVLPASDPTTDNQAARKSYVDTLVAETTGTIESGKLFYNKRGKLYYNLYYYGGPGQSLVLIQNDATTVARICSSLSITQSTLSTFTMTSSVLLAYWTGSAWASTSGPNAVLSSITST